MRRDRNYKLYLKDIKECIDRIEEYTKNVSEEQFKEDVQLQDAVTRRIEIIGEAAKNIPNSIRNINKSIPWAELANFKNLIVHSYFETSLNRIWKIIKKDMPWIKEELKKIKFL